MTETIQKPPATQATSSNAQTGTLTIDEIVELHRGEWVLVRVSKYGEDAWPERGLLLDWAPTQEEILQAWKRRVPELSDGKGWPLYTFLAEPLITSGPEYEAAVMEFFAGLLQAGTLRDAESDR